MYSKPRTYFSTLKFALDWMKTRRFGHAMMLEQSVLTVANDGTI